MENTETKANAGITIFLFLVAASIIAFSVREQFHTSAKPVVDPVLFPDHSSLGSLQKLTLVENAESWTPGAEIDPAKTREVRLHSEGTFSKGYLYVRASIDDAAFTKWESIYVKMNDRGGHLFRSRTLPIPAATKTELLYALDDVTYLPSVPYSEARTPEVADWFTFIREGGDMTVYTFISSLRPAQVEEIALYYDCIEDGSCSLSIIEEQKQ